MALFPQLIAGPIVRYQDVAEQMDHRRESVSQFAQGVRLFLIGLAKKVLIANQMGLLWDSIRPTMDQNGVLGAWVGIIAYSFQIYFDFSGYSDMARGLGNMMGFEFLKNFDFPYISRSITEFWRRWHISLGTWFREYVYIPLGGNRKGKPRLLLNLLIVWFLTGFWHGASWNFILWGLYFGVLLIIEKFFLLKYLERWPKFFQHLYALVFIVLGWVIFFLRTPTRCSTISVCCSTSRTDSSAARRFRLFSPICRCSSSPDSASVPLGMRVYEKIKNRRYYWVAETCRLRRGAAFCAPPRWSAPATIPSSISASKEVNRDVKKERTGPYA